MTSLLPVSGSALSPHDSCPAGDDDQLVHPRTEGTAVEIAPQVNDPKAAGGKERPDLFGVPGPRREPRLERPRPPAGARVAEPVARAPEIAAPRRFPLFSDAQHPSRGP